MNRGSVRLPTTMFTVTKPNAVATALPGPNWTRAIKTAGIAARIEPMFGTKFNRKARIPHSSANSTPRTVSQIQITVPVIALKIDFTARYRLRLSVN